MSAPKPAPASRPSCFCPRTQSVSMLAWPTAWVPLSVATEMESGDRAANRPLQRVPSEPTRMRADGGNASTTSRSALAEESVA